jgi:hypothetical protein
MVRFDLAYVRAVLAGMDFFTVEGSPGMVAHSIIVRGWWLDPFGAANTWLGERQRTQYWC